MEIWQQRMGVAPGDEWDKFATVADPAALQGFFEKAPFFAKSLGRLRISTSSKRCIRRAPPLICGSHCKHSLRAG